MLLVLYMAAAKEQQITEKNPRYVVWVITTLETTANFVPLRAYPGHIYSDLKDPYEKLLVKLSISPALTWMHVCSLCSIVCCTFTFTQDNQQ